MIKLSRNGYHNENGEGPYIQLQPQLEWKNKNNDNFSPYTLAVITIHIWKREASGVQIMSKGGKRTVLRVTEYSHIRRLQQHRQNNNR